MDFGLNPEQKEAMQQGFRDYQEAKARIEIAEAEIKDIIESLAECTGIDKAILKRVFTVQYRGDKAKEEQKYNDFDAVHSSDFG